MLSPTPSLPPCQQLSPSQGSIPLKSHEICMFPPFCPHSWSRHKEQRTSIRCCLLWFPASTGEMLGPAGNHRISVFQGEAARLKQDASALLSLVDTYMAQYQQLQSRTGRWEEEIKQLLRRGEGERAVRGWLGGCSSSHLQMEPWWDAHGTTITMCCPSLTTFLKHGHLGLVFWGRWETSQCARSCWCRVSPAHLLHARQVEVLLLETLELRWLMMAGAG